MAEDKKVTIALVVIVGLLAVVAIVISAISLGRNAQPSVVVNSGPGGGGGGGNAQRSAGGGPMMNQGSGPKPASQYGGSYGGQSRGSFGGSSQGMGVDAGGAAFPLGYNGRIYSLAIGHDYGAHEYFDSKGYLQGFGLQIIDLVCTEAQIDCRIIWDRYENCWNTSTIGAYATGGQGLHDRWYDACTGWYTTVERVHVFKFSQPYLKQPPTHLYTLPGKTFSTNTNNLKNKKIVFISGWASDEICFNRVTKMAMKKENAQFAPTEDEAIKFLNNGWDAIFTTQTTVQEQLDKGTLVKLPTEYSCMIDGNGIMARKDSDLPTHWNRGFNKIRTNGKFADLCDATKRDHAHKGSLQCVDSF